MNQGDFETFGQWLSSRIKTVQLSPDDLASGLRRSDVQFIKRLCDNQSRLPMKDWPTIAKLLQIRLDEFLIVLEYFHPDWVLEYDEFVTNCLRYLLWRTEQDQQQNLSLPELLMGITMDEIIEPACTGRFDSIEERRTVDRRQTMSVSEKDKRKRPRRLSDLIRYLKNQITLIALVNLITSGVILMRVWRL
ncbi:MAG TPA: hypothetical protein VLY20_09165 [Nitrospiria bacterium]|nr:hypothetical protein [Nitrospiria bacterium]